MEKKELHVLVCFAFYNATILSIKSFFPDVGAVFYKNTQTAAIKQIYYYLLSVQGKGKIERREINEGLDEALSLVRDCMEITAEHWNR